MLICIKIYRKTSWRKQKSLVLSLNLRLFSLRHSLYVPSQDQTSHKLFEGSEKVQDRRFNKNRSIKMQNYRWRRHSNYHHRSLSQFKH